MKPDLAVFTAPLAIENGSLCWTTSYDRVVREQIIDCVTTNVGERLMHPNWGCNIQGVLFDPASLLERQDTAAYIRDRLTHFVPRSYIKSVTITNADIEPNVVHIEVQFKAASYSPTSTVAISVDTAVVTGA